jgi:hypothetical protein
MRVPVFSNGVRQAATALWWTGAGLAATTSVLAIVHSEAAYAFLYAAVTAVLGFLAMALRRGSRRVEVITLILLGSQIVGVAGAAWELAYGADDTAKARHLHDLGVNYRWALAGNLAFSAMASIVFIWIVQRHVRGRHR